MEGWKYEYPEFFDPSKRGSFRLHLFEKKQDRASGVELWRVGCIHASAAWCKVYESPDDGKYVWWGQKKHHLKDVQQFA